MTQNRRSFLHASGTAAALAMAPGNVLGANDTIRVGVVGLRGRGRGHVRYYAEIENVEVAALCDTDERILDDYIADNKNKLSADFQTYYDYREMLEDGTLDAVSIATPNHWHALMGIWACQAGKDAYVEKPCSHNLYEGQKLVEAQKKYNRIVAHGTQTRSSTAVQEAIDLLHSGYLGEVYYAKGMCYKWRDTIGHTPTTEAPEGVHYDLWTGPAPEQPFSRNRHHYNWHWQWEYGNGDIGNQGVHEMDVARWGLDVEFPAVVASMGGHFMFEDDQETPNTLVSTFKYPDVNKMLVFEVRHWITPNPMYQKTGNNVIGVTFMGSKGYLQTTANGYRAYLGREAKLDKQADGGRSHQLGHFQNFIDAMRSRKQSDLTATIREGHISSGLCHLANASYRTESMVHFDPESEKAIDNPAANKILYGEERGYRSPYDVPDQI